MSKDNFSDRLIGLETTNPVLRERYEREVKSMIEKQLSPRQKIGFASMAVVEVGLSALFGYVAITAEELPLPIRGMFALGSVVCLAFAVVVGRQLILGRMNMRTDPNTLTGIAWGFLLILMAGILIYTSKDPGSVRSVYMVLSGLVFFVMGLSFVLANRMEQIELKTREKLLGIELRLSQLAEKMEPK